MLQKNLSSLVLLIFLSLTLGISDIARAQGGYDPTVQTPSLLYDEARTVYLGNLARRDNGLPPLRWNRQLTHAARWFSWDSTENRAPGFCGHQDTQGNQFYYRTSVFGYLGFAGAENAFCGYLTPESAIQGWMNSPGHRANLLDPDFNEIGVGYYRRDSDGRGYVTQDFGNDAVYAPVIIENEALSTTSPNVNLYIYDRSTGGGFAGLGSATEMMVSNDLYFSGATWEPYSSNRAWTLDGGQGWRDVYVKTRDKFNRSLTVSDTIYSGASVPQNELGPAQMASTQSQVTLYGLNGGALPQAQFSPGWMADDTQASFKKWWGNGERINDAAAWGGTAYLLYPGNGESFAWVDDWKFVKDTPLVAYFRLKVNDNTSSSEAARISVTGGGTEYGPLTLRGTDFTASNQYQEFAINFTFNTNPNDAFLTFNFWRSGSADLYVDAVTIFSAPQAITSPLTWSVPGNNYRGQGIWVRYTDGSQFSAFSEATTQIATYTISGNLGVGGATLSYTDGTAKTISSLPDGSYSLPVSDHWSGSVTPTHPCYSFSPGSLSYNNVIANQAAQNYAPAFNNAPVCAVTTGVFRPSNGLLYLKNSNATGFADVALNYGLGGDYPVVGDWDGNGTTTIGVYRNGYFYLRNSNTMGFAEVVFPFGTPGDQPIAGDWNGDGIDTIGVYRPSTGQFLLRNDNSEGSEDASFYLGNVGDVGIAGDWDGNGIDTTGVFRPSNGVIFLKNSNDTGFADIALNYGLPGDEPVMGDWDDDGTDTIGIYRNGTFYLRNSNTNGFAEIVFGLGNPGDMPIAGNWDGQP
jgi:cysteine-rich secretory family protein